MCLFDWSRTEQFYVSLANMISFLNTGTEIFLLNCMHASENERVISTAVHRFCYFNLPMFETCARVRNLDFYEVVVVVFSTKRIL